MPAYSMPACNLLAYNLQTLFLESAALLAVTAAVLFAKSLPLHIGVYTFV